MVNFEGTPMTYKTEQEEFWAGDFGNNYIARNGSNKLLYTKVVMLSRMLRCANNLRSARELGCNIGLNLKALKLISPEIILFGQEINAVAAKKAAELEVASITNDTILNNIDGPPVDLTFTFGVLIHINPNHLESVYKNLVSNSKRYILIAEYFSPKPAMITYRGQTEKLFKRDFAGDLIDNFGLKLVDYGFFYRRDNLVPDDDINWFLLEK